MGRPGSAEAFRLASPSSPAASSTCTPSSARLSRMYAMFSSRMAVWSNGSVDSSAWFPAAVSSCFGQGERGGRKSSDGYGKEKVARVDCSSRAEAARALSDDRGRRARSRRVRLHLGVGDRYLYSIDRYAAEASRGKGGSFARAVIKVPRK